MTTETPFNLSRIQQELAASPLVSPYPFELAAAVVTDLFRNAKRTPPADATWTTWHGKEHKLWEEQLGILAHILASTSAGMASVEALARQRKEAEQLVAAFFASVAPLTAEMVRANAFRQEEFLRKWAAAVGAPIAGEDAERSKRRLAQLDYGKSLAEYKRAEATRKAEVARREQLLREAQEAEAAARGWRE